LVDANLLEVAGDTPRYRLPNLFRCYAGERLTAEPRQEVQAATRRALDGYLAMATHAVARIPVPFFGLLPGHSRTRASTGDPVQWLEAERPTITKLLDVANQLGLHEHAWRIPAVYAPYFDLLGRHDDWQHTHDIALQGARQAEDHHGEAIVLRNLGQLNLYQDRYAAAERALHESLRLFTEAGDDRGVGIALAGIGTTLRIRGRYQHALARHRRALRIFVKVDEPNFEAAARIAIGTVLLAQQQFPAAEEWLTGARALSARIGDRHREAHALQRLATLRGEQGDPVQALEHLAEVTDVFRQLGDDHCIAYAQQHTGELCLRTGDCERAQELLTSSLAAHLRSGDRRSAAEVSHLLDQLMQGSPRLQDRR
jgi:tetratricopeptide (TPR) repeat protein